VFRHDSPSLAEVDDALLEGVAVLLLKRAAGEGLEEEQMGQEREREDIETKRYECSYRM